jgi:hypothetical protein
MLPGTRELALATTTLGPVAATLGEGQSAHPSRWMVATSFITCHTASPERPPAMSCMNFEANNGRAPRFGRIRRFAARHPAAAFLLLGLPIVAAGFASFLAGPAMRGAVVVKAGEIVILMLAPTLLIGAAVRGPRIARAVLLRLADRRARNNPQPTRPPIEQLAADLRRLLWLHHTTKQATDALRRRERPGDPDTTVIVAIRTRRLWAMEGAIARCATQAADALDVAHPDMPLHSGLGTSHLRRLLRNLAEAGLVLPPTVGLLGPDERL